MAAERDEVNGKVFNLGDSKPISLLALADLLVELNGGGSYTVHSFPAERKKIDIGDYYSDSSKYEAAVGWRPGVDLREGMKRTTSSFVYLNK